MGQQSERGTVTQVCNPVVDGCIVWGEPQLPATDLGITEERLSVKEPRFFVSSQKFIIVFPFLVRGGGGSRTSFRTTSGSLLSLSLFYFYLDFYS